MLNHNKIHLSALLRADIKQILIGNKLSACDANILIKIIADSVDPKEAIGLEYIKFIERVK